jgi:hypothetical protein
MVVEESRPEKPGPVPTAKNVDAGFIYNYRVRQAFFCFWGNVLSEKRYINKILTYLLK